MRPDELGKAWEAATARPIAAEMTFIGDVLALGAGTRLAKSRRAGRRGPPRRAARGGARAPGPGVLAAASDACDGDLARRRKTARADPSCPERVGQARAAEGGRAALVSRRRDDGGGRHTLGDRRRARPRAGVSAGGARKVNPDQPRVPAGNTDGGQWTSGDLSAATAGSTTKQPPGIQVAHASDRRGHEVRTDATSAGNNLPIVDAAYQGEYHDFLRDQYADILRAAGNTVVKEVPLTIAGDPPITAEIDILFRTVDGVVYGIEVKTGNDPSFTMPQQIVYPHVEAGGIVVSLDPRITALGLTPGIQLNSIHLVVMRTAGPGASIDFFPILRYMRK